VFRDLSHAYIQRGGEGLLAPRALTSENKSRTAWRLLFPTIEACEDALKILGGMRTDTVLFVTRWQTGVRLRITQDAAEAPGAAMIQQLLEKELQLQITNVEAQTIPSLDNKMRTGVLTGAFTAIAKPPVEFEERTITLHDSTLSDRPITVKVVKLATLIRRSKEARRTRQEFLANNANARPEARAQNPRASSAVPPKDAQRGPMRPQAAAANIGRADKTPSQEERQQEKAKKKENRMPPRDVNNNNANTAAAPRNTAGVSPAPHARHGQPAGADAPPCSAPLATPPEEREQRRSNAEPQRPRSASVDAEGEQRLVRRVRRLTGQTGQSTPATISQPREAASVPTLGTAQRRAHVRAASGPAQPFSICIPAPHEEIGNTVASKALEELQPTRSPAKRGGREAFHEPAAVGKKIRAVDWTPPPHEASEGGGDDKALRATPSVQQDAAPSPEAPSGSPQQAEEEDTSTRNSAAETPAGHKDTPNLTPEAREAPDAPSSILP
jgi:hypothetical protein